MQSTTEAKESTESRVELRSEAALICGQGRQPPARRGIENLQELDSLSSGTSEQEMPGVVEGHDA